MRNDVHHKRIRSVISFCCAAVILSGGCGGVGMQGENGTVTQTADTQPAEKAMGRYIESEIELPLPEDAYRVTGITAMEGGGYGIMTAHAGMLLSKDGNTWETKSLPWQDEITYVVNRRLSPDGGIGIIYQAEAAESGEQATGDGKGGESGFRYALIDKDGARTDITFPTEEGETITSFWFAEDGRAFATSYGGNKLYEVRQGENRGRYLTQAKWPVEYLVVRGKTAYVCSKDGIERFDLDAGSWMEQDKVLNDFIAQEVSASGWSLTSETFRLLLAPGEEDTLYLAGQKGIYRHVEDGAVMEQIVDGSLCSMGDPSQALVGMLPIGEEFLMLYADGRLTRFTYDPDMPTVPETSLTAFSLRENDTLRQAISIYQKAHPDIYVKYEVGMDDNTSMTREDVLKNLNTKMMAGKGPDLLLLDELPADSYLEKGLLLNLNSYLEAMGGESAFFDGVLDTYERGGALYAIPARFRIPMIAGEKADISRITDLNTLADTVSALRRNYPSGSIGGWYLPEDLLSGLRLSSGPAWMKADGTLDEAALAEFLTLAAAIYGAEAEGISEEERESYEELKIGIDGRGMTQAVEQQVCDKILDEATGSCRISAGYVSGMGFDFGNIVSVIKLRPSMDFAAWNGQAEQVFLPNTIAGISAGSALKEEAAKLLGTLLGRENLGGDSSEGFPVNRRAYADMCVNTFSDTDQYGMMTLLDEEGAFLDLEVWWPGEQDFARLTAMLEQADTPYLPNPMLEEALLKYGAEALKGECSVEQAVERIAQKVSLYLAE